MEQEKYKITLQCQNREQLLNAQTFKIKTAEETRDAALADKLKLEQQKMEFEAKIG